MYPWSYPAPGRTSRTYADSRTRAASRSHVAVCSESGGMEMRVVKKSEVEPSDGSDESVAGVVTSSCPLAWLCRLSIRRDIIVTEMQLAAVERHPRRRGCTGRRVGGDGVNKV